MENPGLQLTIKTVLDAVEKGPSVFFVTDPAGMFLYVNRKFQQVTGYAAKEVLGKTAALLNSGQQSRSFYREMWKTIQRGEQWTGEYCNCRKNGELFWVIAAISPIFDEQDEIVHYVCIQNEITERVRLRNRLQATIRTSMSGMATLNKTGKIEEVNPAFCEIFNAEQQNLLGLNIRQLFSGEIAADLPDKNTAGGKDFKEELLGRDLTGREFPVMLELSRYESFSGTKFVVIITDISAEVEYRDRLEKLNQKLQDANRRLARLAVIDPLTGLANRRRFEEKLKDEWQRCQRGKQPLALVIIDIDYFKRYNDYYGHPAGDKCLQKVAGIIDRQFKRSTDIVTRYGGEEFAAILPDTELVGAEKVAERIRLTIEQEQLEHRGSKIAGYVTVSGGVAVRYPHRVKRKWDLVEAADRALYAAKNGGRNRICTDSEVVE